MLTANKTLNKINNIILQHGNQHAHEKCPVDVTFSTCLNSSASIRFIKCSIIC